MVYRRGVVVKGFALSQVFVLIIGIFSLSFIFSQINFVEAQRPGVGAAEDSSISTSPGIKATTLSEPTSSSGFRSIGGATASQGSGSFVISRGVEGFGEYNNVASYNLIEGGKAQIFDSAGKSLGTVDAKNLEAAIKAGGGHTTEVGSHAGLWGVTGGFGYLLQGVVWAAGAVGAIQLIGGLLGLEDGAKNSLSLGAGAGIFAWQGLQSLQPAGFNVVAEDSFLVTNAGWIGLGVGIVVFALSYKKESQKIYNFQCLPYQAPLGGKDCEKCNGDPFRPCSEYRCRSLGQACQLVNVGSTDEKCVWVNPNDATSPTITPWKDALTENHRYTNHDTRPTSLGTKIVYNNAANGCLRAFTPLTFGITTNEAAQCKIDLDHKKTFDEMQFFFGNTNLYLYNHTQQFSLPSPDSLNTELPELKADGKYDFFVRCRDANGNENVDEYAVQLCVDPSPDTTAPVIVDTSIPSDSYVKFGAQTSPLSVYVNEPATCKWSTQDKEYSVMENTMSCATSLTQINARELYTCSTNLTGIVDMQENKFYIRCKDQPSKPEEERNVNVISYKYNLRGSQPLNIISVSPNGTATGSSSTVPVTLRVVTDDGANEGVAICSFSDTGEINSYVTMFETDAVEHSQRLDLTTGDYDYKIRCVDYGGNAAEAEIKFSVLVDTQSPLITRAFRDSSNNALRIVTNEDASCAYSLNSCNFNFDEGIPMLYLSSSNKKNHYAEWKPNFAYYIKCRDLFGNEPGPNTCSMVASATNIK